VHDKQSTKSFGITILDVEKFKHNCIWIKKKLGCFFLLTDAIDHEVKI